MACCGYHKVRSRIRETVTCLIRDRSGQTALEYGMIAAGLSCVMLVGGTKAGEILLSESKATEKYYIFDDGTPIAAKTEIIGGLAGVADELTAGDAVGGWGIVNEIHGWTSTFGIELQEPWWLNPGGYPGDADYVFEMDAHGNRADKYSKTYDQFYDYTDVQISFQTAMRNIWRAQEGSDGINVYWNGELVRAVYPDKGGWEKITIDVNTSDGDGTRVLTLEDVGSDNGFGAYVGDVTVAEVTKTTT